ncbi:low molecular weight phosphatase family protein [Corynebacterium lizhenjunii]|uniref:Low molecular weight phosphatase family protein n=1 Tax=Corynebacterium lizhenjunii TaxID=2709394 RepID=A0A7T0KHJ8_9CORY|nr:low molecular weight phosphatase family protein [Corynebacterium lizhenjunii]QPK80014.1 low molecular weight phosphatase family protein [Corynebacterium lizhenjunii]
MTSVLFVCNTNRGKSQMAAALAAKHAPEWEIRSAGVQVDQVGEPGDVNPEAAQSLARCGADMSQGIPEPVDAAWAAQADRVIIVGGADYDTTPDNVERWDIEDPSSRGVEGEQRMDQLRDDLDARVRDLIARLEPQN